MPVQRADQPPDERSIFVRMRDERVVVVVVVVVMVGAGREWRSAGRYALH